MARWTSSRRIRYVMGKNPRISSRLRLRLKLSDPAKISVSRLTRIAGAFPFPVDKSVSCTPTESGQAGPPYGYLDTGLAFSHDATPCFVSISRLWRPLPRPSPITSVAGAVRSSCPETLPRVMATASVIYSERASVYWDDALQRSAHCHPVSPTRTRHFVLCIASCLAARPS